LAYQTTWQASASGILSVRASAMQASALSAHAPGALLSPIVDFAALGAHGGLSFGAHDPAAARAKVASTKIVGGEIEWVLEVSGFAPRALKLLEGAIAFFDAKLSPLRSVAIAAPSNLLSSRASDQGGYHLPLPFSFTDERQHEAKGYNVELQFVAPQPEDLFERVEGAFWSWFSAASVGCFSNTTYPPEISHVYLDFDDIKYHPTYAIIPIEEALLAHPDSSESLINVLQWIHRHIVPLAAVDFYD
jgi:hypothetical protein